jgi:hypothetical protein
MSSFTTRSPTQKTFLQTQPPANHYVRSLFSPSFAPTPPENFDLLNLAGQIISQMMPLLMMRHRRIPRARWRDHSTHNGKHWIEQVRFPSLNFSKMIAPFSLIIIPLDAGPRQSRTPSSVDDWISSRLGKFAYRNGHGTRKTARGGQHRLGHQAGRRRAPRCHCPAIRRIALTQGVWHTFLSLSFFFCSTTTRLRLYSASSGHR